jgi:N-acetylmuramoyl-L-alanine amidase
LKKILASLFVFLFIFGLVNTAFADTSISRMDGKDRFEVSVNLSNKEWPNGADKVVLVNYLAFADALSATPLAYQYNAPILLTYMNDLPDATKAEIQRLNPKEVVIIGGPGSVSDNIISELQSIKVPSVRRIGGADRYEVSRNVAQEMPPSSKVVLAYGQKFSDALSIAPYAARNGFPILLTDTAKLPDPIVAAIQQRNPTSSIIVGGVASVSDDVAKAVPAPTRIDGKDRYEVSANVVRILNLPASSAYVATGNTFADALTGSVVAAKENAPILLTEKDNLPSAISSLVLDKKIQNFVILGGVGSVSEKIINQLIGPVPLPLSGKKIVVDAGHGGKDPGAQGNGLIEKNVVLDVAKQLKQQLVLAGATVIMTRESDTYPTLSDRVQIANSQKADIFLSIHANANTSSTPQGTETYWDGKYAATQSKALAQSIQTQLVKKVGTVDRGIKSVDYYVITNTTMPSSLVELAFITNSSDAAKLGSPTFQANAAQGIFLGIVNYFKNN